MTLTAKEQITRCRIQLQRSHPFFAYLVLNLNPIEMTKEQAEEFEQELGFATIGINAKGDLIYNPEFISRLNDNQLKTILCHEVMHLVLEHLTRRKERRADIFNISSDLVINDILATNNFEFPKIEDKDGKSCEGLVPYNHEYTFKIDDKRIYELKNIDKKSAEAVYDEIEKLFKKQLTIFVINNGFGRFDIHIDKQGLSREEKESISKEWKHRVIEALTYAKNIGSIPAGMERRIEDLLGEKIDWKPLLYRYITNTLPFDYSYNRPSKKSQATGIYMPYLKKEEIDISVAVDTSGSIGQEELTEFLTEIINIAKSFNNIKMKVIVCDSEIHEVYNVDNGDIPKIMDLKISGGGGTDFTPPAQYCLDYLPNTKVLIYFTDGLGSLNLEDLPFKVLWVLSKNGEDDNIKDKGEVIKIE